MASTPPGPGAAMASPRRSWSCSRLDPGAVFVGIIALAAGLRVALLGRNSLWFDEAWVVWVVQHGWRDIVPLLRAHDAHPPLYFLLMKAWVGIGGAREAALRFPSACCGVLSVALTYALARRVSSVRAGLLSAVIVGVSPFAVMADHEVRMYALLGTLAVGSTLGLVACCERGGVLRWGGYVLLAAGMLYTQYLGGLVILAHGIWVAGYERRHGGRWLLAMGAAAVLYIPWVPALWQQLASGNVWPLYRQGVFLDFGDFLGLMAFGGSLFGMGSYFFPGQAGPVAQGLILLPFLVTLWRGTASWMSDRRSLALIGLPLAVSGVAMGAFSLARHLVFYPRWFSFLLPFYAMLLARGLEDIAGRWRGRRTEALGLLTAGLLALGVPVLGRYYFDPGFRPYPWRAAADLVRRQARPGDFLLFVNGSGEIPFEYYFHEPHPSLAIRPTEAVRGAGRDPTFTDVQVRALAERYPRLWIIATPPFTPGMQERLRSRLDHAYTVVGGRNYPGIWVHLYEVRRSAPAPPKGSSAR